MITFGVSLLGRDEKGVGWELKKEKEDCGKRGGWRTGRKSHGERGVEVGKEDEWEYNCSVRRRGGQEEE